MHAAEGDAVCVHVSPVRPILVVFGDACLQARPPRNPQFLGPIPPIEPESEDCLTPTINIWKPSTQKFTIEIFFQVSLEASCRMESTPGHIRALYVYET